MSMKIMGERSSLVRTLARAGVLSGDPKTFFNNVKRIAVEEKVPPKNRQGALLYVADLVRAKGIDIDTTGLVEDKSDSLSGDAKAPAQIDLSEAEIEEILKEADVTSDDGFGFEGESEAAGSPLAEAVRQTAEEWQTKREMKFLWRPFMFQNQVFYLVSSWRLRQDGFEWNLTGTTGNNPVLHRCGADVLHFENESSISYKHDFELTWEIPKRFSESLLAGTTQKVQATVFVWLVKYVAGREFRFWLNEKRDNPPKGVPSKKDIWTRRVLMKPIV